jgi:hypothetical protein
MELTAEEAAAETGRAALLRTVNRINGTLVTTQANLKSWGRPAEADFAWQQASRRSTGRIVVVGETKRGKSTLVNALAGAGALSPIGAEETTATYVSLVPRADAVDHVRAEVLMADGSRFAIEVAEIPRYADLGRRDLTSVPVGIEIFVPPGPLGNTVLTDTPGVGTLRGSQAEVTRRTAADGGALLFVVDAGSPMSQPELDFLSRCAASVEFVVVVVTMIDKYPDSATEMVQHVQRQLARHSARAGRFPVVGASAMTAMTAQAMPDGTLRERLMTISGLPGLHERLSTVGTRRRVTGSVNGLRTCRSAVDDLLREATAARRLAEPDIASTPELLERSAELEALKDIRARWRLDLERDFGRLRSAVARTVVERLDALAEQWRPRIEKSPLLGRTSFRRTLCLEMAADYQLLRQDVATELIEELERILTGLFAPETLPVSVRAMLNGGPVPVRGDVTFGRASVGMNPRMLMAGASGGRLALYGATASGASFALPVLAPLVITGAAAWLAFSWLLQLHQQDRQTLLGEMNKHLAKEKSALLEQLDGQLREVRPEIIVEYEVHLAAQQQRIQGALAQARQSQGASNAELKAAAAQADARISELTAAARTIDDAIALARRL